MLEPVGGVPPGPNPVVAPSTMRVAVTAPVVPVWPMTWTVSPFAKSLREPVDSIVILVEDRGHGVGLAVGALDGDGRSVHLGDRAVGRSAGSAELRAPTTRGWSTASA